ncbi:MAG: M13 family metallopeptidase [Bacteroidales bacterium]|nr:M13 family metallopeptidase [Bacteroidales bacterium]
MKKIYLTLMAAGLFAACGTRSEAPTSGVCLDNLDTTANPVDDFYQYACGGWMASHPLDAEHSRYGTFDKLGEENVEQLQGIIKEVSARHNDAGSSADKVATLYNIAMDSVKLQEQGAEPIQNLLKEVASIQTREQMVSQIAKLHMYGIGSFFGIFNEANPDNSKMQIAWLYQGGLGMGDRDYYLVNDDKNIKFRKAYKEMMNTEFALAGYDKLSALPSEQLTDMVYNLETRMAKAHYDKLVNRDPYKTKHIMSVSDADKLAPNVKIRDYFDAMTLTSLEQFNLCQPEYLTEVSNILATENVETVKAYYAWNIIRTASSYLSDEFVNASFEYYGRIRSGREQNRPRWKRAIGTVEGALGEVLGQLYCEKYFPQENKKRMVTLVENLREALAQRITNATWMDKETKDKALDKLNGVIVKIGYPDTWRDYSGLEIKDDSYFANVLRSNVFDMQYMLSKIDKPTDPTEWLMTPQTVNAYYNPTTNEICFPAGILQPPFFDVKADDAANYGAIGVVIGHELTHGFDDQGRQYDKEGNLSDWWKESDAENFKKNAKVLADFFSSIKVLDEPETYANGEYTLGENIADNGGLHISFLAMQHAIAKGQVSSDVMDGFTPEQRFFLAYAAVWASNIRDAEIVNRTINDVHALGRWRVNGTLPHVTEFVESWNIQPGNGMFIAPEDRVMLW